MFMTSKKKKTTNRDDKTIYDTTFTSNAALRPAILVDILDEIDDVTFVETHFAWIVAEWLVVVQRTHCSTSQINENTIF